MIAFALVRSGSQQNTSDTRFNAVSDMVPPVQVVSPWGGYECIGSWKFQRGKRVKLFQRLLISTASA